MIRMEEEESFRIVRSSNQFTCSNSKASEEEDIMDRRKNDKEASKLDVNSHMDDLEMQKNGDVDMVANNRSLEEAVNASAEEDQYSIAPMTGNSLALEVAKTSNDLDGINHLAEALRSQSCEECMSPGENQIAAQLIGVDAELENVVEDVEVVAETEDGINVDGIPLDQLESNRLIPVKAAIKGIKGKKKRKTIDDILGFSKVSSQKHMGGRSKQKCVVFRSAVAAAALSASISSDGIANRNRILLNEAQANWAVNKSMGIGYEGDEAEVISKIAEMEAERTNCQL